MRADRMYKLTIEWPLSITGPVEDEIYKKLYQIEDEANKKLTTTTLAEYGLAVDAPFGVEIVDREKLDLARRRLENGAE
jgi:hypothetical protein